MKRYSANYSKIRASMYSAGKYMTDCRKEFPENWYQNAKLCPEFHDLGLNFFGVNALQPVSHRREKAGLIILTAEAYKEKYIH